ncbi:N-formylglutamate amidohydrolase [Roseibium litorale]|uniref:N-formylglutamate amidohydrolase n=1 Tax=Roseibium litorale TaxID=2803841 RepID=A0ABR9CM49_9HYPH|nr:N-formylglutamate amidohydrolase [Roseibium litorale]MBD8891930.1 N-formylglutamate amidohydrolase [Roseibium litorale]
MIIVEKGESPLILCLPHAGADLPPAIDKRLSATGRLQTDISWRLEQVFDFAADLDATTLRSTISRYVIDVDKDPNSPDPSPQVPGDGLCPVSTLDMKRIYKPGEEPGPIEIEQRGYLFHQPFHQELIQEIARVRSIHGYCVLFDCKSIRSKIAGRAEDSVPVISATTADGQAGLPGLQSAFLGAFEGLSGFSIGADSPLADGYILRAYGAPERGIHALGVSIAQRSYLRHESTPYEPDRARISRMKMVLTDAFTQSLDWARSYQEGMPVSQERERSGIELDFGQDLDLDFDMFDPPLVAE